VIPQTQTRIGDNGNCFAAALASILDERQLPEFGGDDRYWDRVDAYLARRGLKYRRVPLEPKPVGYSTVEGISPRGGLHACVAKDGEFVHDPHPVEDDPRRGLRTPKYYGLLLPLEGGRAVDALRIDTDGSVHHGAKPAQQYKRWATKRNGMDANTPLAKAQEYTRRANELRREARQLWDLASPTRQGWYIKHRLSGKTPEQAIALSRGKRKE